MPKLRGPTAHLVSHYMSEIQICDPLPQTELKVSSCECELAIPLNGATPECIPPPHSAANSGE